MDWEDRFWLQHNRTNRFLCAQRWLGLAFKMRQHVRVAAHTLHAHTCAAFELLFDSLRRPKPKQRLGGFFLARMCMWFCCHLFCCMPCVPLWKKFFSTRTCCSSSFPVFVCSAVVFLVWLDTFLASNYEETIQLQLYTAPFIWMHLLKTCMDASTRNIASHLRTSQQLAV